LDAVFVQSVLESAPHENVTGHAHVPFSIVQPTGDVPPSMHVVKTNKQNVILTNNINAFDTRFYSERFELALNFI
jgi:hypothetical protein